MANIPAFVTTPRLGLKNVLVTDSTGTLNVITGGDNGTRVYSAVLHNKPATARLAHVALTDGTNVMRLATASVNSTGATSQDVLATVALQQDAHGNNFVLLPNNSWSLAVSINAAVATDNDVSVVAHAMDF